jgi:hypothetical protein
MRGTLPFMPPEAMGSHRGHVETADIFSAGVVLVCLFLRLPEVGQFNVAQQREPRLADVRQTCGVVVAGLVSRAYAGADAANLPAAVHALRLSLAAARCVVPSICLFPNLFPRL